MCTFFFFNNTAPSEFYPNPLLGSLKCVKGTGHYRLDLTDYARKDMAGYFRVNRFFAQQLAPHLQPDDLVWAHDYHLIPLAAELRQMGVRNRIGFFMHIPWPPPPAA